MIILTTSAASQTISVIPREYENSEFTMSIRDDSTNITTFYPNLSGTTVGNYLTFNNIFSPILVEGHFFDLHLYLNSNFWNTNFNFWELEDGFWNIDDGEVLDIFKDRIFCTDQDVKQLDDNDYYKLNKGQYTEYNGFDNTYTVPS